MEIDEKHVAEAVTALTVLLKQKHKKDLLVPDDETRISIQLSFKKIPSAKQTIKIDLPTPLVTKTTDVCLFVKDLDKKNRDFGPTIQHYKDLLASNKVTAITQVISLKQLKLEYQPHEAKRNLSNQFDVFLADERIMRLLPSQLGASFYKRKRQPSQVNLQVKDLKKEITRALTTARCSITAKGSCCMVAVGHTGLSKEQLIENIVTAAKCLGDKIPGGPGNVRAMCIKGDQSNSVPIYFCDGSSNDVTLPKKKKVTEKVEPEDVTTVEGGKVKVDRFSRITVVSDGHRKRKLEAPPTGEEFSSAVKVDDAEIKTPAKKKKKSSVKKEVKEGSSSNMSPSVGKEKLSAKKECIVQPIKENAESDSSSDEEGELEKMYEQKLSSRKKKASIDRPEKETLSAQKKKVKKQTEMSDNVKTPAKTGKKTPKSSKKNLEKISGTPNITPKIKTPKSVKKGQ